MLAAEDLAFRRHAQDLREVWQARVLAAARGEMGVYVLSVLAHNFDDAMPTLLRVVFPGFTSIAAPFLGSAARIRKHGQIVADMVHRDGRIEKDRVIFASEAACQSAFRRIADELKLSDDDRRGLFAAVQKWIVADYRIDPNTGEKSLVAH